MNKKPNRRKTSSQNGQSTDPSGAANPSTEPVQTASETTATDPATVPGEAPVPEAPMPGKVTRLPAFGFAEDLLGKKASPAAEKAPGNLPSAPAENGASVAIESQTRAAAAALAAGGASSTDPERIFQFADSLGGASAEYERAAARRMGTWVSFALAGETFALPVEPVREVVRVSSITRVPHAPKPIRGVTNLRGRVIPVIDLRLRIDLPPTKFERTTRIIVVAARGRLIGLLVDAVQQVVHLDLDQIQPPPDDVMTMQSDYILGVYHFDDSLVLLLNVERALTVRGVEEFTKAPTTANLAL